MVKIYEVGDFVKCIDITEENHERLIRGTVYTVAGVSVFDGNIVYAVKDSSGNLFHTMDRFEKVGQSDVEPEIGWIRCDVGIEGTEKKQMTCGAGFTALDFEPTNAERFYMVMDEMLTTYTAKNADYGNSFEKTFEDYGMTSIAVRLSDKYLRLRQLTMTGMAEVKDESVRDTLLDMANYSIMAIMEMDKRAGVPVPSQEEVDAPCNRAITAKQIGFIAGLTRTLGLDRCDLPEFISPLENYKELSEAEGGIVIDKLISIVEYKKMNGGI